MTVAEMGGPPAAPRPDEIEGTVLHALDDLDQPEQTEGFGVHDEGQADWALRKLVGVRDKIAEVNASAERQMNAILESVEPFMEPIRAWRDEQLRKLETQEGNWEGMLILYHRSVLLEDSKALSIERALGTLKSRKFPDKWEFEEEAFLAWAAEHAPEFVRVKQEIDKPLVKKTLDEGMNGERLLGDVVVPHVKVALGERNFEVVT